MFSREQACEALSRDHDLLAAALERGTAEIHRLTFPGGELSLLDLVVHVTMWDEINLAVLTQALHGQAHWSLAAQWETAAAGGALNTGGVRAGRSLPAELIRHRFHQVRQAHIDAIARVSSARWEAELPFGFTGSLPRTLAGLCHYINTPEADPSRTLTYRHAAVHLV